MDLGFALINDAVAFTAAVGGWSGQPRLWIDVEVADYYSKSARVSLLQVRDSAGTVTVVDCLRDDMQAQLNAEFVPRVMGNPAVEKWAHHARYEQRFLGGDTVQNLHCTLALAKELPYYRLPTRSCSLAALVRHFWGLEVDKSFRGSDWGLRPLGPEALAYAAWDAEWCHRLWAALQDLSAGNLVPSEPEAIAARFAEFDLDYKLAQERREAIRDAVREFMIGQALENFAGFQLSQRDYTKIELRTLVECLLRADPHDLVSLQLSLTKRHQDALGEAAAAVQELSEIVGGSSFRVPTTRHKKQFVYDLDTADPDRVEHDFHEADHNLRLLSSERDELKAAIKTIMLAEGRDELLGFQFADRSTNWRIDPRALGRLAPASDLGFFPLTAKIKAVFETAAIELPDAGLEVKTGWVLRSAQPKAALVHEVEAEQFD